MVEIEAQTWKDLPVFSQVSNDRIKFPDSKFCASSVLQIRQYHVLIKYDLK